MALAVPPAPLTHILSRTSHASRFPSPSCGISLKKGEKKIPTHARQPCCQKQCWGDERARPRPTRTSSPVPLPVVSCCARAVPCSNRAPWPCAACACGRERSPPPRHAHAAAPAGSWLRAWGPGVCAAQTRARASSDAGRTAASFPAIALMLGVGFLVRNYLYSSSRRTLVLLAWAGKDTPRGRDRCASLLRGPSSRKAQPRRGQGAREVWRATAFARGAT